MTPVIQVSDSVFSRLQSLARPFVDTPSLVIERLLDQTYPLASTTTVVFPDARTAPRQPYVRPDFNLFLAPASSENARVSLTGSVSVARACQVMKRDASDALKAIAGTNASFHCWAMTESRRHVFRQMRRGDVVLFSLKGTGQFDYRATVSGTVESTELGDTLWPITSGLPWSLIYLLEKVSRVNLRKSKLVVEFGFERDYVVPGIVRVKSDDLGQAIDRHGSFDALLRASS